MKMKSILSLEKELEDVIIASENDVKNKQWINRFKIIAMYLRSYDVLDI